MITLYWLITRKNESPACID